MIINTPISAGTTDKKHDYIASGGLIYQLISQVLRSRGIRLTIAPSGQLTLNLLATGCDL